MAKTDQGSDKKREAGVESSPGQGPETASKEPIPRRKVETRRTRRVPIRKTSAKSATPKRRARIKARRARGASGGVRRRRVVRQRPATPSRQSRCGDAAARQKATVPSTRCSASPPLWATASSSVRFVSSGESSAEAEHIDGCCGTYPRVQRRSLASWRSCEIRTNLTLAIRERLGLRCRLHCEGRTAVRPRPSGASIRVGV